jgi:hypothetical protein
MKLRNKKTGEHGDYQVISAGYLIRVRDLTSDESWQYDCLAGFNDKWEDYEPVEPLIEDEKVRKAVRAWAEADGVTKVYAYAIGGGEYTELYAQDDGVTDGRIRISLKTQAGMDWGEDYTIEELCGEEEQCES